ncbi:MAG: DUF4954 family protein [Bacteroidales bacterium]|jgi:hypothetical protein|nr:DUF4954 family protein [Bacteroidales bacterium]
MRLLNNAEIEQLERNGCTASPNWDGISVGETFNAARVRNVVFIGKVEIEGWTEVTFEGVQLPFCLYNTTIVDCHLGENSCVINTTLLSNYNIHKNVTIIDCGIITGKELPGAVEPLNESGIYSIQMHPHLTSNIAHMAIFHGHRNGLRDAINRLAAKQNGVCYIGDNAVISGAKEIRDSIILSAEKMPTTVKAGVTIRESVVQEGSHLSDHAKVERSFVGQSVEISSGMTMENSMAFANAQLLCGEAISAFCGPYTVSHHKTSLLIAGAYSFFNAGSGTNASNHHYRLGPRHQAVYCRGAKSGSGSYILAPAKIGAFSMVVGHHKSHPDTSEFPFSLLIEKDSSSVLLPAQNLRTISLARDEQKWQDRDHRHPDLCRDCISTDTFNPLIINTILKAATLCHKLSEKESDIIMYGGCKIQRLFVVRAELAYQKLAEAILLSKFFSSIKSIDKYADENNAMEWIDLGGFITTKQRTEAIENDITSGNIATIEELDERIREMAKNFADDEVHYVRMKCQELFGLTPTSDTETLSKAAKQCVGFFDEFERSLIFDAERDSMKKLSLSYSADYPEEAYDTFTQIYASADEKGKKAATAFCESRSMAAKAFII